MLYLTEDEVRRLLPMRECIGLMRTVFQRLASGEAANQPRRRLTLPTRSTLHYMAGSDGRYFGAKVYATNPAHGAHFLFLLYRAEDAAPLAIVEANHLGQIRTGAASGLATSLMARPDSKRVAIIGSGFQARTQLEAMTAVLSIGPVMVWSRLEERRAAFARECSDSFGLEVRAAASAEEAVRGADIVITATNAKDPVLEDAWIVPGMHINAMGSNQAARREIPAETVRRARVVMDNREQAEMEAGDLILAARDEGWTGGFQLQDVAAGRQPGRTSPAEVTLFKSIGIAAEDVAAAAYVYERAMESGAGRPIYS
ncbi:MAG TPA: ornithine cyclodeaminase family protein [Candidatus Limnocylindrales bacterium]|nr:ornithine cyclodeaminase family protein [Candidatus Limnocylindrales bacterium]